jgi:hypothetical protein
MAHVSSVTGVRAVALPAIIVVVMKGRLVDFTAERNELVFRGRWVRSTP